MMKYKNYLGHVEYDDEAKLFHGEVVGLSDVITFQGSCVEELEQAFRDSVDDYLAFCKKLGRKPEKVYSGKLNLRLPSCLHGQIAVKAKERNVSINDLIVDTLSHNLP